MALKDPAPFYNTRTAYAAAAKPPVLEDTPVMDRGEHSTNPETRVGFTIKHVTTLGSGFNKRDDKDNRPGTPVPFHEPDPLRFEKAEALRQSILAQEKRRGGTGAYTHKVIKSKAPAHRYYGAAVSSLPDVPVDKVWPHYTCLEASAAVSGERDGVVLFFESAVKAQTAMTGRKNNGKNIAAAAAGISRGAYGWTWTRLKRSTTGPKGEEIRARRLTK